MLVQKWMSENVITISPHESAIKASILLRDNHIKHLPVVEKDKLVGIVTNSDMLRLGIQLALFVVDNAGETVVILEAMKMENSFDIERSV